LGDTVRTSFPAPSGADVVFPSRGPGLVYQPYRPTSPLVRTTLVDLLHPSTFSSVSEVVAYFGIRHRLLQPWFSRTRLLQSFLAPPCSCTLSNAIAIRPWALGVLQGFHRKTTAVLRRLATDSARPLSWGFAPSSGHQRKGSGFYPGISTSPAVASSGFEPSRRLDPLHAFPTFLPGPLLGLHPSGLFSSR